MARRQRAEFQRVVSRRWHYGRMSDEILTVFRSRLHPEFREEYLVVADRMSELTASMPGFISRRSYTADDGERVTVVLFADADSQSAWRDHPEHRSAQKLGMEKLYSEYSIEVATVTYQSSFQRGDSLE